ncbi:MAG: zinc ABC transporter substrate-binding protein [Candidatus Bathyarchaeota archaeon]|nr:zinc ABC transporter substrate-binding protein [Candidatus Termiticorpusculum sp.]
MNRTQKIFLTSLTLITLIALVVFMAYTVTDTQSVSSNDKLNIVTTIYPLTYLTQQIGGDYVKVTQLIPNNVEIHSWEPSVSHIMAAEDANIIFYNGADADHWLEEDILPALSTSNNNRIIIETTANLPLIPITEPHEHNGDNHSAHDHGLYDPHTWLSPYMAKQQAKNIYDTLIRVDPQHEKYYTQNWHKLEQQLEQLDNLYLNSLTNNNPNKKVIFVSHEAYGYLADRYDFTQHGAIGLSADQQPSITSLSKLINEMKEYQTYTIYFDPVYSDKYIQTIKNDVQTQTGQTVTILKLYLLLGPIDNLDYLEQMQTNLVNLQTSLETPNKNK